ncbi:unnamed protein product [Parnassius mnemosyne]|uniref:DUF5641 domain-containing protein n=1 Tax=Parnassius mnemosyne TaxID=213953 RepID=A0AAV1KA08_9NEOP
MVDLYKLLHSTDHERYIGQCLSDMHIQFKRNPPLAPYFGGIWESNIKSVKSHLYRVVGKQVDKSGTLRLVQKGCIVIIRKYNSPPLNWPLGIVEDLYPGKEGITRTVKIKTQTGSYIRPVVRLCPLPLQ